MQRVPDNDNTAPPTPLRGWVLYDGGCRFCRRLVTLWGGTLRRHGFEIAPLQTSWVRKRLKLPEAELLRDMRLLLKDGRQIAGANAYRQIMRHIPLLFPMFLLASVPGLRRVFDKIYRWIADRRECALTAHPRAQA